VTTTKRIRHLALKVADALDNPDTWCAGDLALDHYGRPVNLLADQRRARRWCAYGHARRIGGKEAAWDLSDAYQLHLGARITDDNDCGGREYVRDRLLALARNLRLLELANRS
jgi:hypothetical protein